MITNAIEHLINHGIKPSAQRISIMEYLISHRTHPSVDMIYADLIKTMPTLSKTTIYNTLKLLEEKGAILELTIDKKTAHYDGFTAPHSHFLCRKCGKIYDMPLNENAKKIDTDFQIDDVVVYYHGVCKDCLQMKD